MAPKTIPGNAALGEKIRNRRNELGLTIEEAASRAGVGMKTWFRYETGAAIRLDKVKNICKALNWRNFPDHATVPEHSNYIEECKTSKTWSSFLADHYGKKAAASFVIGSDMLLDYIEQDLTDLAAMPSGTHIGQLQTSFINTTLPAQFLMRYDYEFLYQMKCSLISLRRRAHAGTDMYAHSVLEELIFYLCAHEASVFMELNDLQGQSDDLENSSEDWVFDLFDDEDLLTFLYSDTFLDEEHPYFFSHWNKPVFYL